MAGGARLVMINRGRTAGAPESARTTASKHRGLGRVYQSPYRDPRSGEQKRTETWWIQYFHRGTRYRESSGSPHRADAVRLLRKRLAEMGQGRLIGPDAEKTTFEDLAQMLLDDYVVNQRKSLATVTFAIARLPGLLRARSGP
jgi:hypothetical protein